jgi:hypothetical protein
MLPMLQFGRLGQANGLLQHAPTVSQRVEMVAACRARE